MSQGIVKRILTDHNILPYILKSLSTEKLLECCLVNKYWLEKIRKIIQSRVIKRQINNMESWLFSKRCLMEHRWSILEVNGTEFLQDFEADYVIHKKKRKCIRVSFRNSKGGFKKLKPNSARLYYKNGKRSKVIEPAQIIKNSQEILSSLDTISKIKNK